MSFKSLCDVEWLTFQNSSSILSVLSVRIITFCHLKSCLMVRKMWSSLVFLLWQLFFPRRFSAGLIINCVSPSLSGGKPNGKLSENSANMIARPKMRRGKICHQAKIPSSKRIRSPNSQFYIPGSKRESVRDPAFQAETDPTGENGKGVVSIIPTRILPQD